MVLTINAEKLFHEYTEKQIIMFSLTVKKKKGLPKQNVSLLLFMDFKFQSYIKINLN